MLDLGTWSFPDGNVHIHGMFQLLAEDANVPHLVGYNTIVLNANKHSDGTGPVWGILSLETGEADEKVPEPGR